MATCSIYVVSGLTSECGIGLTSNALLAVLPVFDVAVFIHVVSKVRAILPL